jgi:hypothetical protein
VDQFGLAMDGSAWHYRNDRARALNPTNRWVENRPQLG